MIRSGKLAGVRTEFQYKKRKFAGIVQKAEFPVKSTNFKA
jgi:hypothetical protein